MELAREGNRYLNDREPWKTYKKDKAIAGQSVGISVQIVASVGITLQPFLPRSSYTILKSISRNKIPRWNQAGKCFVKPGTRIRALKPLFHKVSANELRARLMEMRSNRPLEAEV